MFVLLLLACRPTVAPEPPVEVDASVWAHARTLVLGRGTGCTIVAIHGYGASPEGLERLYTAMDLDATVVLPRAPIPQGTGHAWFMSSRGTPPSVYAEAIEGAARRLTTGLIAGVPGHTARKPPIITGFSQGGMLSWTVATTRPDLVSAALPIGGLLPETVVPVGTPVPIDVFHGTADNVVPYAADQASAQRVEKAGWPVELHTYEGVPHTISPSMHRDYAAALNERCR